jgi:hypothetical protein
LTEEIKEIGMIDLEVYCLPKNFSLTLFGSYSTPKAGFMEFRVEYCN